jgi:adenine-specific DNA-methyltransferase
MRSKDPAHEIVERVRQAQGDHADSAERRALIEAELQTIAENPTLPAYAAFANGVDALGAAYETLITADERRAAGQFRTPFWAADLMSGWLLQDRAHLLLDPGVGSGGLLFRAASRSEPGPSKMLGLDVDPICISLAQANLRLREISDFTLRQCNFLLDDIQESPDALICNPPYSRHQVLSVEEKTAIHEGFEARLGVQLSRRAGLHVLFLVRALEVLADGGRLAFITPASWLDVNYGHAVKSYLLDHAHVEALIFPGTERLFFDGVLTTAAITLIRKGVRSRRRTKVIHLPSSLPHVDDVLGRIDGRRKATRTSLSAQGNWASNPRRRARGKPLTDLAQIRRGVATGRNQFFVLSEDRRREWKIRRSDLMRCIASPRFVGGVELHTADLDGLANDVPRWLLSCRRPGADTADTALGRYLRWGKELGAHESYLASHRKPWFALERRESSPILFTYMNRKRPRFIRNRAEAVPLNTFLIIDPVKGIDTDRLWEALNASRVLLRLREEGRSYGGGLWKLEPGELGQIRVRI